MKLNLSMCFSFKNPWKNFHSIHLFFLLCVFDTYKNTESCMYLSWELFFKTPLQLQIKEIYKQTWQNGGILNWYSLKKCLSTLYKPWYVSAVRKSVGNAFHKENIFLMNLLLKSDSHCPKKICFVCFSGSPLKNDEKRLFHLKSSFRSQNI